MNVLSLLSQFGLLKEVQVAGISASEIKQVYGMFSKEARETDVKAWVSLLHGSGFNGSMFDYLLSGEWLSLGRAYAEHTGDESASDALRRLEVANRAKDYLVQDMTPSQWSEVLGMLGIDLSDEEAKRMHTLIQEQGFLGSLASYVQTGGFTLLFERRPDMSPVNEAWECGHCNQPNMGDHNQYERNCNHCGELNLNVGVLND